MKFLRATRRFELVRPLTRERLVSAPLARCFASRRRSFDRSDSGRSVLAAGTGLRASLPPLPKASRGASVKGQAVIRSERFEVCLTLRFARNRVISSLNLL